jgi:hypothetical protein
MNENIIFSRLKESIESCNLDFFEFSNLLKGTGSILSGSSVLSILTGDFIFNDLDIYVPCNSYQIVIDYIKKNYNKVNYPGVETKLMKKMQTMPKDEVIKYIEDKFKAEYPTEIYNNHKHRYHQRNEEYLQSVELIDYFIKSGNFADKIKFINTCKYDTKDTGYRDYIKIDIIVGDDPLDMIKEFDLSCLLNWFDGITIHIGHLDSILTKNVLPNNYCNSLRIKRINKYIYRGFNILCLIYNQEDIFDKTGYVRRDYHGHWADRNHTITYEYLGTDPTTFDFRSRDISFVVKGQFKYNDNNEFIEQKKHNLKFKDLVNPNTSYKIQIFSKPPIDLLNEITCMPPNNLLKEGGIEYQKNKLSFDDIKNKFM